MFRFFKKHKVVNEQEKIDRANRASSLLQDDSFKAVLSDLENERWDAFFNTSVSDYESRERLHLEINALRQIEERLGEFVQTGENIASLNERLSK